MMIISQWLNCNDQGFFAQSDEGKYWSTIIRPQTAQKIAQQEHSIIFNFQHLFDLAIKKEHGPETHKEEMAKAYDEWLQTCLTRYPYFKPFLLARAAKVLDPQKNSDTGWEKAFHPEELETLKYL